MNNKLEKVVIDSLEKLCSEDAVLIHSEVKEECINHKLAQYIEQKFNIAFPKSTNVNIDVEYNKYKANANKKKGQTPIRPDIIIHERQSCNNNNYLVIEAKKGYSSKHDKEKIEYLVNNTKYKYSLGCVISYQPKREYIIIQFWHHAKCVWKRYKYKRHPFTKM